MKADLDFDIVAHFGNFRNVDLLSKGIYIVQTKLYYGVEGTLIAPVGMFSSPSTLPPAPVCSMCEVHDGLRCFRTRSIIIRYKDERYELNDGVHWRLTLPACNVATDDHPSCPRPLHLKFELLYAPFLPPPTEVKVNLMTEIHKLVPDDPLYSVIATQNVVIERAGSGIHAYYPVHFNGSNIAELDCMVHCAITGIRFPSLTPKPIASDVAAVPTEGIEPPLPSPPNPDSVLPPVPPPASVSAGIDSPAANAPEGVTTPVKSGTSSSATGESSERDGTLSSFTPGRSEGTSSSASASLSVGASPRTHEDLGPHTGSKRSSQRYVPIVSPLTTKLETAGETATVKPSAMRRMTGHITNLRHSITQSVRSPVPMMGKAAEVSVAGARKLGAITSALASPIATRLRFDHSANGGAAGAGAAGGADNDNDGDGEPLPMADESITPARAEEQGINITVEPVSLDLSEEGVANGQNEEDTTAAPASPDDADEQRPALIEAAEMLAPQLDPILDPEGWLDSYAHCVVANYKAMHSGIKAILDLYAHVQRDDPAKLGGDQAQALQASCLFESQRSEIMVEILLCAEEAERREVVKEKVDLSNLQVTLHWSLLMTALRRVMPQLCPLLKEDYRRAARAFWRGQILIQTKSFVGTTAYLSQETNVLLDLIDGLVTRDEAHGVTAVGSTALRHHDASCAFALHRKLRIYDVDMMQRVAKLPHMVLQQYFSHEDAAKVDIVRLNAKLAAEKEGHASATQELSPSKLRHVLQAVRDALARGATLPAGTLYLSRGGELLEEAITGGLGDGQVLDITRFPALVPALPQILGEGAGVFAKSSSDSTVTTREASSERDTAGDGDNTDKPTSAGSVYAHDFVAAHQRLVAAGKAAAPVHLVVLQHGFLGQGYDMQMIENALRLELGFAVETFVPRSNEGKEHDSIAQMGKRLAFELVQYCKEYHPELLQPGTRPRISFIGHSMGGLIVRQALTESTMKPLHSKLHAYVSLATPHVGALFPDSKIVSTGMWALFKWKKYKALKELVLEDSLGGKTSKTLLFKLSESHTLAHFRKVVLLSSPKDQYVPVYSARIQTSPRSESNHDTGAVVSQMVHNILHSLRAEQVVRITMDNNVGEGVGVNSLIGRTAHICYLENPVAAKALVYSIAAYLQ